MHRRHIAPLVLALLLVVSGCSGLFGADATPTPSPEPATPTEAPFTYPAGYSESGITDSAAAKQAYVDGILSYDSFTFGLDATIQAPERAVNVSVNWRVDKADNRALLLRSTERSEVAQFYVNGTSYVRTHLSANNKTWYNKTQESLMFEDLTGKHFVGPLLTNVTYGTAEVVERDGERLARYGKGNLTGQTSFLRDPENVTSFSASLLVNTNGVIRHIEYHATIANPKGERSLDVVIEVSDLGSTTVEQPEWYDKAASS